MTKMKKKMVVPLAVAVLGFTTTTTTTTWMPPLPAHALSEVDKRDIVEILRPKFDAIDKKFEAMDKTIEAKLDLLDKKIEIAIVAPVSTAWVGSGKLYDALARFEDKKKDLEEKVKDVREKINLKSSAIGGTIATVLVLAFFKANSSL